MRCLLILAALTLSACGVQERPKFVAENFAIPDPEPVAGLRETAKDQTETIYILTTIVLDALLHPRALTKDDKSEFALIDTTLYTNLRTVYAAYKLGDTLALKFAIDEFNATLDHFTANLPTKDNDDARKAAVEAANMRHDKSGQSGPDHDHH